VVGGGVGGLLNELLKYPVELVDYAEPDPALIQMVQQFPTPLTQHELADPRVRVHPVDGRLLVQRIDDQARAQYDLLVASLPYPSTLQLNRLYTVDFFRAARSTLSADGLLVITSPGSLAYMSPGIRALNASLYNALAQAFPHVHVIPGEINLWLASAGLDLAGVPMPVLEQRWQERGVPTLLVSADHINYKLRPDRLRWFWETIQAGSPVEPNRDLHPSGLLYGLLYWSELFSPGLAEYLASLTHLQLIHLAAAAVVLTLLVAGVRARGFPHITVPFAIGTTGFAGMTLDLLVIFAFQILHGYVYQQIGLLVTAFMTGLSLGSWWMARWLGLNAVRSALPALRPALLKLEAGIVVYLTAFPLALAVLHAQGPEPAGSAWMRLALLGLNTVAGLLVGLEFPLANAVYVPTPPESGETAGILYAADLVGACLGALLISVVLLPALGILETCIFLIVLKLGSLVLVATSRRRGAEP
jgi:spermidine synthase